MRRRLVTLSLATTALVVISFLVPLALLVRRQAADDAKVEAERQAQSLAGLVALALALEETPASMAEALGSFGPGTVVALSASEVIGDPLAGQGTLLEQARVGGSTIAGEVPGGWEIALPVIGPEGTAVVDVMVSDETLSAGVSAAWLLLAALALALIAAAVWVADWMGRGLVTSIEDLARSAHDLAGGDLGARVEPQDPPELREVGEAFNYLAGRLDELLIEERESVADLSHRLRTPLTSVKLQAESLADPEARSQMLTQVDRLEQAMNQVIELARSPAARPLGSCVLDEVVRQRTHFWAVLTEDQGGELTVRPGAGQGRVLLDADAIEVILDALIGNVLTHTPPGARIEITTGIREGALWLEVSDDGPGFGDIDALQRGFSGAGSTGLGLDIVRKEAEAVGGSVEVANRPAGGGAVVRVVFG